MYQVILHLFSLRSTLSLPRPVRLQLTHHNARLTISPAFILSQQHHLHEHLQFHLSPQNPTFHLQLVACREEGADVVVGSAVFDARQWQSAVQNYCKMQLGTDIQVELSVKAIFHQNTPNIPQPTPDKHALSLDQAVTQPTGNLPQSTLQLHQQLHCLRLANHQLASQIQLTRSQQQAVKAQRQQRTEQLGQQNGQLRRQLDTINFQLRRLVDLVGELGGREVCRRVSDLLGGDAVGVTSAPSPS